MAVGLASLSWQQSRTLVRERQPTGDTPMVPRNSDPRGLQQQHSRDNNAEQQQAGSNEFQPKPEAKPPQQMGEGSYEATRDYQKNIKDYLKDANVEADAEAAKPHSEEEARELDKAEQEGRSHSKGEH
jgi:hypothetical protein